MMIGKKLLFFVSGLLTALAIPIYAIKVYFKDDYSDFHVYYLAANRILSENWSDLYTLKDGSSPLRYVPPLMTLFLPFAHLPINEAQVRWFYCQVAFFAVGFYFLSKTIGLLTRTTQSRSSATAGQVMPFLACATLLLSFRLILDTLLIGQTSGLLLAFFALAFYSFTRRRTAGFGVGLSVPVLFKIGPGIVALSALGGRKSEIFRGFRTLFLLITVAGASTLLWHQLLHAPVSIWSDWAKIVASDSVYYDSSHYGSQSLNSFFLRLAQEKWISIEQAGTLWLSSVALVVSGCLAFWSLRRPRGFRGRAGFFSMGICAYLWLMPETFKYTLTCVAIPLVWELTLPQKRKLDWLALSAIAATISLAGKDLIGDFLFFEIQKKSLPLFSTLLLGACVVRGSWEASYPSRRISTLVEFMRTLFGKSVLVPWKERDQTSGPAKTLEQRADLSILVEIKKGLTFEERSALQCAKSHWIESLAPLVVEVFETRPGESPDFGARLREAFFLTRADRIWLTTPDGLQDKAFFESAWKLSQSGIDLVRGNRRLPGSLFEIPVRILGMIYSRHRIGVFANRALAFFSGRVFTQARTAIPTDLFSTQLLMTRRLANRAFVLQQDRSLFVLAELAAVASSGSFTQRDLPVTTRLHREKSPLFVLFELLALSRFAPSFLSRVARGFYRKSEIPSKITADDWGISEGVNRGILELAKKGIVRRISIMAGLKHTATHLEQLTQIPGIQLGIHLNFTYGRLQKLESKSPLAWLLRPNYAGFKEELILQLASLKKLGVKITYLDGHHHIHLIPGLVGKIAAVLKSEGIFEVRLPYHPSLWLSKQFPINVLSLLASREVRKFQFRSLPCFYPKSRTYESPGRLHFQMSRFAESEIICHPAIQNDLASIDPPDSYQAERVTEFRCLELLGKTWSESVNLARGETK